MTSKIFRSTVFVVAIVLLLCLEDASFTTHFSAATACSLLIRNGMMQSGFFAPLNCPGTMAGLPQ